MTLSNGIFESFLTLWHKWIIIPPVIDRMDDLVPYRGIEEVVGKPFSAGGRA